MRQLVFQPSLSGCALRTPAYCIEIDRQAPAGINGILEGVQKHLLMSEKFYALLR